MAKIPTVTEIINKGRSPERERFLSSWKESNPNDYQKAGNNLHSLVKKFFNGSCRCRSKESNTFYYFLYPYLIDMRDYGNNIEVEKSFSTAIPPILYRGRVDLIVDSTLYEFKTRNSDKELPQDSLSEYLLQLAAYTFAFPQIENSSLVIIYKDREPEFLLYTREELLTHYDRFSEIYINSFL
jgi:hypothetical protein